jgi:hypothetical protein
LSQCLSEHPEVGIPEEEVYFFSTRRMVHSYWQKGLPWYSSVLSSGISPQTKVWGEITPFYLYDEDSASLIKQTVPGVKLICCLRDQSERAYSWYTLFLRHNPDLLYTRFSFHQFLTYCADVYGREGFYLEHIKRYLEFFPRESILFLLYDDLEENPRAYIRRVFSFLGVDESFCPPAVAKQINSMRSIHMPKSLRWDSLAKDLNTRGFLRLARIIQEANSMHIKENELPGRHRMSSEIRERMHRMFLAHNEQLGAFLGRDVTHWNTSK